MQRRFGMRGGAILLFVATGVFAVPRDAGALTVPDSGYCADANYCLYTNNSGSGAGMRGFSYMGPGVDGSSSNSDGVHAVTYHSSHSGIYAQNLAINGGGYGIYAGVGGTGKAVHGQNTNSSGWAGYFDGKVYASAGFTSSDARLKKDIADLSYGLRTLTALRPVAFKWKDQNRGDDRHLGFLAQDLQKVVPEIVDKDGQTGMLSVNYPGLVPVLVKAIQEQQAIIQKQESRIATLEQRPIISSMFSGGINLTTALGAIVALAFVTLRERRSRRNARPHSDQS